MNTFKLFSLLFVLLVISKSIYAQKPISGRKVKYSLELIPKAYSSKGYGAYFGLSKGSSSLFIGILGFEYPEDYNGNNQIIARTNKVSFAWDYTNPKLKGFYMGMITYFSHLRLDPVIDDSENKSLGQASFGVRAGYRLMFGHKRRDLRYIIIKDRKIPEKGFYLNLFFASMFNPTARDVSLGDEKYKIPDHTFLPSLHWGWKF
ncbi:hypothetical protein [Fulvivirga lutea]|uniref:DUF3575 domain-containing protein n=1 Tax=Fulvivirga lutea TaxID=2810512 RepID=A0A975A1T0_9BACT|nr:hypothetical protein [Fulvivirga lutea]QSE98661.1 hypothetical protein JR347_06165 [Fulvivirga lutea]